MLLLTDEVAPSVLVAKMEALRVVMVLVVTVNTHLYQPPLIAWIDLALNNTLPEPALFDATAPVFKSNQQLHRFPNSTRRKLDAFFLANTENVIVEPAVNDCDV